MRRLISMLAAGLLAAGSTLAGGAASAGPAGAQPPNCTNYVFWVTSNGVNYYLGTPRRLSSGSAATLKPTENNTTTWYLCNAANGYLVGNGGLALTSRASSPGADVTLEPPGNGGTGFASQQWLWYGLGCAGATLQNQKTGLYLRVRNGGPVMGQTVTTGSTATVWMYPVCTDRSRP